MSVKFSDTYIKYSSIIKKMFDKKFFSKKDILKLREKIEILLWLNGKSNYSIEVFYGKVELLDKNPEEAVSHFEDAILNYDHDKPTAAYYGLFKAYVDLENYKLALENLCLYASCFQKNFNMTFYFNVLSKLLELNESEYEYEYENNNCNTENYVNCVKCPAPVLKYYKKAERLFEKGNYLSAIENLKKCQEQCVLGNYMIDVRYLIKLLNKVYKLTNCKSVSDIEKSIKKINSMKSNYDKKCFLEKEIENPNNVYAVIELVKILIEEGNFKTAYFWLNHKMDKKQSEKYIRELNELRKIVYEEVGFEKNKSKIDEYLARAEIYIVDKDYTEAFKLYQQGYDALHCPVFIFKKAELNYSIGNISKAFKYFINYLDCGEKFKIESYIYLSYIELIKNKDEDSTKYDEYLEKVENLEKYVHIFEKAEDVYYRCVEGVGIPMFEDKDSDFNNYYAEIISNIKKGKIYKIETIDDNKIMPEDLALIKISAAPILLEQGAIYLSDKYYQSAIKFSDNDRIMKLAEQYKLLRNEKNPKN